MLKRSRGLIATLYVEGFVALPVAPWEPPVALWRGGAAADVACSPNGGSDGFVAGVHTRLAAGAVVSTVGTAGAVWSDRRFGRLDGSAGGSGSGGVTSIGSEPSSAMSVAASVPVGVTSRFVDRAKPSFSDVCDIAA